MQKKMYAMGLMLLLNLSVCCIKTAHATDHVHQKMAVVNQNRVFEKSEALKRFKQSLHQKKDLYQKEISQKEIGLQKEQKILEELQKKAQTTKQAADEFERQRRLFEQKVIQMRDMAAQKTQELENEYEQAVEKVKSEFEIIVRRVAERENIHVVFQDEAVLVFHNGTDLTDQVIQELNKTLQTISSSGQ